MKPITKTDFCLGLSCLQKLRHQRAALPSLLGDNALQRMLAEGSGALEALQRSLEPPHWVGPDGDASVAPASLVEIKAAIAVVQRLGGLRSIYGTTLVHGDFLGRIDLLRVHRDRLELVEINPMSWEGPAVGYPLAGIISQSGQRILEPWLPCLQGVAFKVELLRRWLRENSGELGLPSDLPILPKLILSKAGGVATQADCLANFRLRFEKYGGVSRAEFAFNGPDLRTTDLLIEADVSAACLLMERDAQAATAGLAGPGIAACMEEIAEIVRTEKWPPAWMSFSTLCKLCEYDAVPPAISGKTLCWGGDVDINPLHILKFPWLTDSQVNKAVARTGGTPLMATLSHLELSDLQERQKKPWWHLFQRRREVSVELIGDRFGVLQAPINTPLSFLHFEAARFAIPYRPFGKANELVTFQFSAHRLPHRDAKLTERKLLPGFLDLEPVDLRRSVVRALREQLGPTGPIYHWGPNTHRVISSIARSLANGPHLEKDDLDLVGCCHQLLDRLVDLGGIARLHVFLPETHGSYSRNRLLPVIWADEKIRAAFTRGQALGDPHHYDDPIDPQQSLPNLSAEFLERLGPEAVATIAKEDEEFGTMANSGLVMLYYNYLQLVGGHERPEIRQQFQAHSDLASATTLMTFDWLRRVTA